MKAPTQKGQVTNASETQYWRSIGQSIGKEEHPDWADREFPEGASELPENFSRRDFLKLMGASAGLAGAGMLGVGCRRPEEIIVPFGSEQEPGQDYVHGVPMYFATAMPTRTGAIPLLAESNEGRPTKVSGNPDCPSVEGSADGFAYASILNLYDPDRARQYIKNGKVFTKWNALDELSKMGNEEGKRTAFLMPESTSPSRKRLIKDIQAKFGDRVGFYVHEALDFKIHQRAATEAFGRPIRPSWKLAKASVVLSLDCDFMGAEEGSGHYTCDFSKTRKLAKASDQMSRLYSVEALLTQTGANADHRLRSNASQIALVASYLARKLGIEVPSGSDELGTGLTDTQTEWLDACLKDLKNHSGKGLVLSGYRQPEAVHILVHRINDALGNNGKTIEFLPVESEETGSLQDLANDLGKFDRVIDLGCNVQYDGGASIRGDAITQRTAFRLTHFKHDESHSSEGIINAPRAHYLESWGDAFTSDGTLVPVQPLIAPLFDAMSELEVLAAFIAGKEKRSTAYEVVQSTFNEIAPEQSWERYLHVGFLQDSQTTPVNAEDLKFSSDVPSIEVAPIKTGEVELIFTRDYSVDDGRFANNGWCQEVPDPITKITWDNVISVSRLTSEELNLKHGEMAELRLGEEKVEAPVWVQPGQADNCVGLPLGYGRTGKLRIANFEYESRPLINNEFFGSEKIPVGGFDFYPLRSHPGESIVRGGKIRSTGKAYPLSSTQEHWSMEGRPIIREATLSEYRKSEAKRAKEIDKEDYNEKHFFPDNLGLGSHARNEGKIYKHPYKANPETQSDMHQWGMSVDLNSCMGCNACVIACQSENNIPIVGKEQVANGREMHWLRIDRYYTGRDHNPQAASDIPIKDMGQNGDDVQHTEPWIDDPQVVNMPMSCVHCESAPCESVCPVNATVHDAEGMNVMAYNRCVGTRYCSNNCAWKVRRFNYFDYNKRPLENLYDSPMTKPSLFFDWLGDREKSSKDEDEWDLLKLAKNPQVSVRMRGVMEKCDYCSARIQNAKIAKKVKAGASGDVMLKDADIKTACQSACSADAITFGNLLDKDSAVVAEKANTRTYETLDFLDNGARTTYLAKVRNPNPDMPDAYEKPFSTKEYKASEGHGDEHDHHHHEKEGDH